VKQYAGIMTAATERMLGSWRDGETRDIHHDMMKLTLEVAVEVLFGADVHDRAHRLARAFAVVGEHFQVVYDRIFFVPERIPIPGNRRYRRALASLDREVDRIIAERRDGDRGGNDLLALLLEARDDDGRPMSDRQLRDEIATLFAAGHETTAVALTWTLLLLGRHPEVEARLHTELDDVLAGRPPSTAELGSLPFTEAVVLESMRLYPPAWVIGRKALEDVELGGYTIPRGTNISMSQWVVHRDARNFEHPLEFDPDRWRDGLADRLPRFAWFPFGGGQRRCIGASFATTEARLLLATIAQRWRFVPLDARTPALQPMITLRPKGGLTMRVESRTIAPQRPREYAMAS
jgi:cytochrome P450